MKDSMRAFALGIALAMIFPLSWSAESKDPVIGTWDLNLQKSKFVPGPPPKTQTRTYVAEADGVKLSVDGMNAKGEPVQFEYTAGYDGKDYPVTGAPMFDSILLKRADDGTVNSTAKKGGKVVSTSTRAVSKDGKELRVTTKGTNENGETYTNVMVFDKRAM